MKRLFVESIVRHETLNFEALKPTDESDRLQIALHPTHDLTAHQPQTTTHH
jgi:hypothetical protein